ncbi:MAG: peptidoglycan-associated lipoprotein Pal [Gammaproteobacteria bacterium]|nr:peptidoglycan-associated lipoprotein Pal [Gammaproteobacteria bacterium]MBU1645084.1 peptidoglycan-associated lipoprotein Pal [Gammaproteobacteria bacterium]MBU1973321.1 peptidoglycan-associated lipoprotein Pal [Gammaproteobacteria bacterium]
MRTLFATLAIALPLLITGCSSQPPAAEQPGAGVEDRKPTSITTPPVTPPAVTTGAMDPYSIAALKDPKSILSKRSVYFDFDMYVVKDEFKSLIEAHAKFLVNNPKMKMLIQGNADERGSREYNLALGQKRAEAVKKALLLLGAKEEQVESVSLGEEKPACADQTEECWARNRRGDMLYSGEF